MVPISNLNDPSIVCMINTLRARLKLSGQEGILLVKSELHTVIDKLSESFVRARRIESIKQRADHGEHYQSVLQLTEVTSRRNILE